MSATKTGNASNKINSKLSYKPWALSKLNNSQNLGTLKNDRKNNESNIIYTNKLPLNFKFGMTFLHILQIIKTILFTSCENLFTTLKSVLTTA